MIDIPLLKQAEIKTIGRLVVDSMSTKDYIKQGNNDYGTLYNLLKTPIETSRKKRKELLNPTRTGTYSMSKLLEIPLTMPSVRDSIRERLIRKLWLRLLRRQRLMKRKLRHKSPLKTLLADITSHSFDRIHHGCEDNDVVLGYKKQHDQFFKIVENKKKQYIGRGSFSNVSNNAEVKRRF